MIKAGTMINRGAKIAQVSNYDELQQEKYEASLEFEGDQEGLAARIAEIDAKQVDGGNLEIAVDELVVENIKDKDKSYTYGVGVSASSSGTNLSFSDGGYDKKQTTYATIGSGSINVGGEEYEGDLNRDINSSQVITRDDELGGFDVSVNVDHRLFTKEGRQEWKAEKKQEVENFKNLGRNVKRAGKNVKNATDDLSIAVSENLKGEGNGIFEDYERKTEGTEMALQMAIKQEEITNIISNPEEHSQEELQGAITALVGSTSGAEVNFYEGDELTDDQRMTVDGEDKSALPGFYDAEGNTIYLNADKTNSISDLLTVTRHENQHAIDDQDGVDYTTYSQDKDHYEDLAKKSESEFMYSLAREFGDNPNKESTSAFTDMDAGSNGAGGVEQVMPFEVTTPMSIGNQFFKLFLPTKIAEMKKSTDNKLEWSQEKLDELGNSLVEISFTGQPYTSPAIVAAGFSYGGSSVINFLRLGTADKNDKMDLGVNLAKDISLLPLKGKIGDEIIQLINYSDKNN